MISINLIKSICIMISINLNKSNIYLYIHHTRIYFNFYTSAVSFGQAKLSSVREFKFCVFLSFISFCTMAILWHNTA